MTDDELREAIEEARLMASAEQKLSTLERLRLSVLSERRVLRVLTVVAIVVGMVGIGLSVWSIGRVNEAEASRADNRVSSCVQFNEQQQRSIHANEAQVREVFRSLTSDDELTSDERAALDRLFEDHDAVIVAAFPMRDCSDEGIDAYFDDDETTDPFVTQEG